MRMLKAAALAAALAATAGAQEPAAATAGNDYSNSELGLRFQGLYGWRYTPAEGSGAWTELARYEEPAYDASVVVQMRTNPFSSFAEMEEAIRGEFAAPSGAVTEYKEVAFSDAEMRGGAGLPGIEATGVALLDEEGKKREQQFLVRTYFGKQRLYRVHASARRSRYSRVQDLFRQAMLGLVVREQEEKVVVGTPFRSERGRYECSVPEGYMVVVPPERSSADVAFERAGAPAIGVYSYRFDGLLEDHLFQMQDYYGRDLEVLSEDARMLGDPAFKVRIVRDDGGILAMGVVRGGRAMRVHVTYAKGGEAGAQKALDSFLTSFRILD